MRVNRKELSFVREGLGVRVNITLDGDALTRDEKREATEGLASSVMLALAGARYINAPLSKIKVR